MEPEQETPLTSMLDSLGADGVFDSEGVFTIDGSKAVGTLAEYLLPNDGSWILKVVQSSVMAGALSMEVATRSQRLRLKLVWPIVFPHRALRENLGSLSTSSHPGVVCLCQGLRAVSMGEKREMALLVRDRTGATLFQVKNGLVTEKPLEGHELEGETTELELQVPLDTVRRDKEARQLRERARACPLPLKLNSHRLDDLCLAHPEGGSYSKFLGALWVGTEGEIAIPDGVRTGVSSEGPLYVAPFGTGDSVQRLLAVHYQYEMRKGGLFRRGREQGVRCLSRLHLLHLGVVVGSAPIDLAQPITVDLFVPTRKCDATGLQAEVGHRRQEKAIDELALFAPQLSSLGTLLSQGPSYQSGRTPLGKVQMYLRWSGKEWAVIKGAISALGRFRHELPRAIRG